jgi:hypothetical protein
MDASGKEERNTGVWVDSPFAKFGYEQTKVERRPYNSLPRDEQ